MSPCTCSYHYKLLCLMIWLALPALCFCSYPSHWLSLAFLNQRPCGMNIPCSNQECWFIREAGKLSSCRHSWCLEALSAVSGSVFADCILFRRQHLYLFSHTKSSERLATVGWSEALEAISSGTASFHCPASNDSAFPKHTLSPPPTL